MNCPVALAVVRLFTHSRTFCKFSCGPRQILAISIILFYLTKQLHATWCGSCCKRVHRLDRSVVCCGVLPQPSADVCTGLSYKVPAGTNLWSSPSPVLLPTTRWPHNRIPLESQMSSLECSLSEKRMLGKRRSCKGFAIRPRVRRSTSKVQSELAIRYVLVPDDTFDLIG